MKFITACLLAMFISGIVAYANVTPSPEVPYTLKQLNIVDENTFSNNNTVSRGECLTTIMRSIGLKDEYLMSLNGADFYAFVDTESYSYYGCAYRAQIAYGEECIVKYDNLSHLMCNVEIEKLDGGYAKVYIEKGKSAVFETV